MPKVTGTRKQKAMELYQTAQRGPGFLNDLADLGPIACDNGMRVEAKKDYDIWAGSWILPALEELVPELKPLMERRRLRHEAAFRIVQDGRAWPDPHEDEHTATTFQLKPLSRTFKASYEVGDPVESPVGKGIISWLDPQNGNCLVRSTK